MSKELAAPEWLDDVIVPADCGEKDHTLTHQHYTRKAVIASMLAALQRDRGERPARRPWSGRSNSDHWDFANWLAESTGLDFLNTLPVEYTDALYELFCAAYDASQPGPVQPRPWASLNADPTHPADFADFDKFCRWIRANKDPDEHFELLSSASDRDPYDAMLWLYGLLRDAYEGTQPAAPGSETGGKP